MFTVDAAASSYSASLNIKGECKTHQMNMRRKAVQNLWVTGLWEVLTKMTLSYNQIYGWSQKKPTSGI